MFCSNVENMDAKQVPLVADQFYCCQTMLIFQLYFCYLFVQTIPAKEKTKSQRHLCLYFTITTILHFSTEMEGGSSQIEGKNLIFFYQHVFSFHLQKTSLMCRHQSSRQYNAERKQFIAQNAYLIDRRRKEPSAEQSRGNSGVLGKAGKRPPTPNGMWWFRHISQPRQIGNVRNDDQKRNYVVFTNIEFWLYPEDIW